MNRKHRVRIHIQLVSFVTPRWFTPVKEDGLRITTDTESEDRE